jgi:hypothetical protein
VRHGCSNKGISLEEKGNLSLIFRITMYIQTKPTGRVGSKGSCQPRLSLRLPPPPLQSRISHVYKSATISCFWNLRYSGILRSVEWSKKVQVWTSWPLKMGTIRCPESSVKDYHSMLRNITEGRAMAQAVSRLPLTAEALRYKPERRGFYYRWCHWNLSLT